MEEDISDLRRWGYDQDMVQKFQDEGIKTSHLKHISEYSLEKLLPKIGDRIFLNKIVTLQTLAELLKGSTERRSFFTMEKKINDFYCQKLADEIVCQELKFDISKRKSGQGVPRAENETQRLDGVYF